MVRQPGAEAIFKVAHPFLQRCLIECRSSRWPESPARAQLTSTRCGPRRDMRTRSKART